MPNKNNPEHKPQRRIIDDLEEHKYPQGIVINPYWLKVAVICFSGLGSLGMWGISEGYIFASATVKSVSDNSIAVAELQKADIPNRLTRVEITQQMSRDAQDRMETKLDRLFEVWHQPNPAPKPREVATNPTNSK